MGKRWILVPLTLLASGLLGGCESQPSQEKLPLVQELSTRFHELVMVNRLRIRVGEISYGRSCFLGVILSVVCSELLLDTVYIFQS